MPESIIDRILEETGIDLARYEGSKSPSIESFNFADPVLRCKLPETYGEGAEFWILPIPPGMHAEDVLRKVLVFENLLTYKDNHQVRLSCGDILPVVRQLHLAGIFQEIGDGLTPCPDLIIPQFIADSHYSPGGKAFPLEYAVASVRDNIFLEKSIAYDKMISPQDNLALAMAIRKGPKFYTLRE